MLRKASDRTSEGPIRSPLDLRSPDPASPANPQRLTPSISLQSRSDASISDSTSRRSAASVPHSVSRYATRAAPSRSSAPDRIPFTRSQPTGDRASDVAIPGSFRAIADLAPEPGPGG